MNEASAGDIITIDPASGASTVTGLELPAKSNPNHLYITIRSSKIYNLPANTRVSPADPNLATLAYTFPGYLTMFADQGAGFYRFEGIKFTTIQGNSITNMIQFGHIVGGRMFDHQASDLSHDIEFDRCVFAGWPGLPGPYRAIMANMGRLVITNSAFVNITGVNSEAQDIAGWNGTGPFILRNNYLESSTMETLFGGAVPNIQGIREKDLQFIGNEYRKRWSWKFTRASGAPAGPCLSDELGGEWYADASAGGAVWNCVGGAWAQSTEAVFQGSIFEDPANFKSGTTDPSGTCTGSPVYKNTASPSYWRCASGVWGSISIGPFGAVAGDSYWEKNHWELKNAERAIAEGNYLHESWSPGSQSQHGACALFNQVDNNSGKAPPNGEPSAVIANVRFAYNWCDQTPWGVSNGVLGTKNYFQTIHDIEVSNNLFTNLGGPAFSSGDAQFIQSGNTGKYSIVHNTVIAQATNYGFTSDMNGPVYPGQEITFSGNILSSMHWGFYNESGAGNLWNAIDASWALNRAFSKNVIVNSQAQAPSSIANNLFRASDKPQYSGLIPCPSCAVASSGYENGGTNDVGFANYAGGDYHLKPTSPYAGWWANGSPAGADIDQVLWSTAGARTGQWNPFLDFRVRGLNRVPDNAAGDTLQFVYTSYDAGPCTIVVSQNPDLSNPSFSGIDSGGDRDRIMLANVSRGRGYFYGIACSGFSRSGHVLLP